MINKKNCLFFLAKNSLWDSRKDPIISDDNLCQLIQVILRKILIINSQYAIEIQSKSHDLNESCEDKIVKSP